MSDGGGAAAADPDDPSLCRCNFPWACPLAAINVPKILKEEVPASGSASSRSSGSSYKIIFKRKQSRMDSTGSMGSMGSLKDDGEKGITAEGEDPAMELEDDLKEGVENVVSMLPIPEIETDGTGPKVKSRRKSLTLSSFGNLKEFSKSEKRLSERDTAEEIIEGKDVEVSPASPPAITGKSTRKKVRFGKLKIYVDGTPGTHTYKPKKPKAPVLKHMFSSDEMEFRQWMEEISKVVTDFQTPALIKKISTSGSAYPRHFKVSEDGTEIMWKKPSHRAYKSKLPFASVQYVIYGPRTQRFDKYDWKGGKPWLCFSLACDDRTLDLEFYNAEQMIEWLIGCQLLSPLSHRYLSKARIRWNIALLKTICLGFNANTTVHMVWAHLVHRSKLGLKPSSGSASSD